MAQTVLVVAIVALLAIGIGAGAVATSLSTAIVGGVGATGSKQCGTGQFEYNITISTTVLSILCSKVSFGNVTSLPTGCAAGQYARGVNSTNFICSAVGWIQLTGFPAGCPTGSTVEVIGSTITCIGAQTGTFFQHLFQYLPLDENTLTNGVSPQTYYDLSDDGWGATAHGTVSPGNFRKCVFLSCIQLDGSTGYLQSTISALPSFVQGFTWSTWVNATALTSTESVLMGASTANGKSGFTIGFNTANVNVTLGDGTNSHVYLQANSFSANKLYNIVVAWTFTSGTNGSLTDYVNGTALGTSPQTTFTGSVGISGVTEYDIGRYSAGATGAKYCACFIDDYRWYNQPQSSGFVYSAIFTEVPFPFEDVGDAVGTTCSTGQYLVSSHLIQSCAPIAQDYRLNMAFNIQFQNNTHDYISNINGTAHAAAGSVGFIKGVIGEAANFTKTNSQYFDYANFAPANFGSNGFTVMAWFQTTCSNAASCTIMSKGYTASATGWLLRMETNGHLGCGVQATSHSIEPTSSASYNTGKPQFAVCTWNTATNTLTLYVNGSSVATGTQSGIGSLTSTNFFQIGVDGASNFMSGWIADVRGYQFPFTSTQVSNEWNFQNNLINGV